MFKHIVFSTQSTPRHCGMGRLMSSLAIAALMAGSALIGSAKADPFSLFSRDVPRQAMAMAPVTPGAFPQDDQVEVQADEAGPMDPRFARQLVTYQSQHAPGTIVVDTPNTYLYYVLGNGRAIRYGIGVGREGFTWSGVQAVTRMMEWPDWNPPADMIRRQPYLPRFMAGGPGNPLGARALYLGNTVYRIHGTNNPSTIGGHVSSGCIRMTNEDVSDLYSRVQVGTRVVVLPMTNREARNGKSSGG